VRHEGGRPADARAADGAGAFPEGPLLLGGFMASGKTTVGRILAGRLRMPFLDADEEIARRAGRSVRAIFAEVGEEGFRCLEAETVRDLLSLRRVGIALGGGALTDPALREEIRRRGTLVVLGVSAPAALERAAAEPGRRPLLEDPARAEALLASREAAYASGHLRVETEGLSPEAVAEAILRLLPADLRAGSSGGGRAIRPIRLEARCSAGTAPVLIGPGLLPGLSEGLPGLPPAPFHRVSDDRVGPLYADRTGPAKGASLLPRGEASKSLGRVARLYGDFLASGLDRGDRVVALGGGVVGDAAGFAAATWLRGVPLIQCPTSLLAQVDSSLGGKVGVDLPEGKNLVGAFHFPVGVVMDLDCLQTLPEEEFRQGLGEAVKYAVGEEPALLDRLDESRREIRAREPEALLGLVSECARIKLALVAEDERELSGARARLNLGHTVGHGLEASGGYGEWKHGDGVAVGLAVALELAVRRGEYGRARADRVLALMEALGLPRRPDRPFEAVAPFVARDKKFRGGRYRLVLPREGERCRLEEVPSEELREAYEALRGD